MFRRDGTALRRIGETPQPASEARGRLTVLLSGREDTLPQEALAYAEGRDLQALSHAG